MIFKYKEPPKGPVAGDTIRFKKFLLLPRTLANKEGTAWLEMVDCIGTYYKIPSFGGEGKEGWSYRYYKINREGI